MRITGLASGLDMDQIVKDSMKPYRVKIDQQGQKKEIVEIKQKLYREVIKDSREFYNKYFDVANKDSLLLSSNYGTSKFTSSDETSVSATGLAGAKTGNYKVTVEKLATSTKSEIINPDDLKDKTLTIEKDGKTINVDLKGLTGEKEIVNKLDSELSNIGIKAEYSDFTKGIVVSSKETGKDINFTMKSDSHIYTITKGENARVKLEDSNGNKIQYGDNVGEIALTGNRVVVDGIDFKFNDVTPTSTPIKISGKTDSKEIKEKLVNFINDYNKLIEKLNTMTSEKRDKSFMPLTAEQKKSMSEDEVKLWNEKVKKGQLSRDQDVTRIANSMKQAMRDLVEGSGLSLEKIGIKPVANYQGTKNGTFTIDEKKLTESLEQNSEEVMNLFIKSKPTTEGVSDSKKYIQSGLMQRLKSILYEETVTVGSSFIKKVGIEGSSTIVNNELTKTIEKHEKKMKDLEKDFSRREQLLYTKYSKLEKMMNKYNSQQNYLAQQLGR
ncbi:flagellar hook-associated protein 2 [Clostridium carnis]